MKNVDRRKFLKLGAYGATAASLPASISRALAIPAHTRTRSLADVEHIVILTQENRSFDHYFGSLNGVRGFNDPHPLRLPTGKSVWHQTNGAAEVLPFRPDVPNVGNAFLPDPPHGWNDGHRAWNEGRYDRWVPNKGAHCMSYLTRRDIPFHYALADAFTLCDAYFCSVKGPTDPNRYHMWTGWLGNDGAGGGPVITNAEVGYDWSTYPERLQRAGITWKVYQDIGVGLTADGFWGWTGDQPYIGNYGDNSLLYFHQYQNAQPGSALATGAKTGTNIAAGGSLFDMLRDDVTSGRLPQVSWIAAPEAFSEHPNWPANFGAWYVSQVLDALTSNPDVWSRTALFLHFDEEGGFFDHMMPPNPPENAAQGLSTVTTANEIYGGDGGHPAGHYGLGVRVPMIAISPWSKGGYVNSQVFDHTSLIRFIEARHGQLSSDLIETNITPWRRAVVGDLTSVFDFKRPNAAVVPLPGTRQYEPTDRVIHPDDTIVPPVEQHLPHQEPGVRRARALPYALHAQGHVNAADNTLRLDLGNVGTAGAVLHARWGIGDVVPRSYTIEAGKRLADVWPAAPDGRYDLEVHGPNGFFRGFKGNTSARSSSVLDVRCAYARDDDDAAMVLTLGNVGMRDVRIAVKDGYTGETFRTRVALRRQVERRWTMDRHFGWYDFIVTVDGDDNFEYRLAGHIENGRDSITDPHIGGLVVGL